MSRLEVYKWVRQFREEGRAGLADRSSRPHRSPTKTSARVTARITKARVKHLAGPVALSGLLNLPVSTIGAVLRREQMPPLCHLDQVTGEVIKGHRFSDLRYEHHDPGSPLHVDVKKLGKNPNGGGWRLHGRGTATPRDRGAGWDFVHVAVDDRSRVAYVEVLADEKGTTCAGFLYRAARWFRDEHGVTIRRVLTDNAKNYLISRDWIAVCSALQIKRRYIKPHCPWTNGKAERFNRTFGVFPLSRTPELSDAGFGVPGWSPLMDRLTGTPAVPLLIGRTLPRPTPWRGRRSSGRRMPRHGRRRVGPSMPPICASAEVPGITGCKGSQPASYPGRTA